MQAAWIRSPALALALAGALTTSLARPAAVAATPSRSFDTDGDGDIDLTIYDTNGDGYFEWPTGTKSLPGRLDVTATDRIAFSGSTTIQTTQGVSYADGSELVTRPGAPLVKLAITANGGDVIGYGLVDLAASGDVIVTAKGHVALFGTTHVTTPGTITLSSKTAGASLAQLTPDDYAPGAFALLAGKAVNFKAAGNNASIFIELARVGSRVINLTATSSNSSGAGPFFLRNDALVTTDPARTGLSGTPGNITLSAQRTIMLVWNGATIDSAKNVVFKTQYGGFLQVCTATVEANDGAGTIDTRYVSDGAFKNATSTINGIVVGKPFVPGCQF